MLRKQFGNSEYEEKADNWSTRGSHLDIGPDCSNLGKLNKVNHYKDMV
jgi:hypothetical protein